MIRLTTLMSAIVDIGGLPKPTDTAGTGTIDKIVSIVFTFSASIAVLLIVIGGFRYIVAHGDPNATAAAKNTILYALVGLIVVMVAYSIVTFVVRNII